MLRGSPNHLNTSLEGASFMVSLNRSWQVASLNGHHTGDHGREASAGVEKEVGDGLATLGRLVLAHRQPPKT